MTASTHEPRDLLTVQEVAHFLHVSDDTVRRQVRQGQLEAIHLGKTPTGRTRLRIPRAALEKLEGFASAQREDPLETLRSLFAQLSPEQQEQLIDQAVIWARQQQSAVPQSTETLRPEPTLEELALRFPQGRSLRPRG